MIARKVNGNIQDGRCRGYEKMGVFRMGGVRDMSGENGSIEDGR